MPIGISQPLFSAEKTASIDAIYGPYESIAEAVATIPKSYRSKGRTVGIKDAEGRVVDYMWKWGEEDYALVLATDFVDIGNTPEALSGYGIDSEDPLLKEITKLNVERLPVFNSLNEAITALGDNKLFRYSSGNIDGIPSVNDNAIGRTGTNN